MNGLTAFETGLDSAWLDDHDACLRLLATLGFALVTVSLQRLPALSAALVAAALMAFAGGLRPRVLVRRLAGLQIFLALLIVTLPFTVAGEPWIRAGHLTGTWDGVLRAAAIALKANAVVLAVFGLMGSPEPRRGLSPGRRWRVWG